MRARSNVSALAAIVVAATASFVILFVIRTAGASNLPSAVYWFFLPAIIVASKASGNFDGPNDALLLLGMFLETFALVLGAAWLLLTRADPDRESPRPVRSSQFSSRTESNQSSSSRTESNQSPDAA